MYSKCTHCVCVVLRGMLACLGFQCVLFACVGVFLFVFGCTCVCFGIIFPPFFVCIILLACVLLCIRIFCFGLGL